MTKLTKTISAILIAATISGIFMPISEAKALSYSESSSGSVRVSNNAPSTYNTDLYYKNCHGSFKLHVKCWKVVWGFSCAEKCVVTVYNSCGYNIATYLFSGDKTIVIPSSGYLIRLSPVNKETNVWWQKTY
jgi:hypothetical protein